MKRFSNAAVAGRYPLLHVGVVLLVLLSQVCGCRTSRREPKPVEFAQVVPEWNPIRIYRAGDSSHIVVVQNVAGGVESGKYIVPLTSSLGQDTRTFVLTRCLVKGSEFVDLGKRSGLARVYNYTRSTSDGSASGSQPLASETNPSQPLAARNPALETVAADNPVAMMGTWRSRDPPTLVELGPGQRWKWWDLSAQSRLPSEPPDVAGSWFVRNGILFLRIEKTMEEAERIGPSLAFTYDVKSVTPEAMVLHQTGQEDMTFRRIAEGSGAHESH
jgi:hypothetical protein